MRLNWTDLTRNVMKVILVVTMHIGLLIIPLILKQHERNEDTRIGLIIIIISLISRVKHLSCVNVVFFKDGKFEM